MILKKNLNINHFKIEKKQEFMAHKYDYKIFFHNIKEYVKNMMFILL